MHNAGCSWMFICANGQCKIAVAIGTESINIPSAKPHMNELMGTWTICPQQSSSEGDEPEGNLCIIDKLHLIYKYLLMPTGL